MPIPTTFRRLLRPAARPARLLAEGVWNAGFRIGGLVGRGGVRHWSSGGDERVLVVSPHPDDETIGCGGTLASHVEAGDDTRVLFVTDGRRSRALGLAPEEMARRRQAEALAAVSALGLSSHTWLGLPEGEWTEDALSPLLLSELRAFRPTVIYAPSRVDFHPEHVRTAHALGAVVEAGSAPSARVRVFSAQVPLTALLVNLVHDVSGPDALPRAAHARALKAYVTQEATLRNGMRPRRYAATFYGLPALAEEFWEMRPESFARVHAGAAATEPWKLFRGIRPDPWSDPLAYAAGRSLRRALKRSAATPG